MLTSDSKRKLKDLRKEKNISITSTNSPHKPMRFNSNSPKVISDIRLSAKKTLDSKVEHEFCKKYSRINTEEDVFKRQQFESYKRHTKDDRLEAFVESVSPLKKKLTKV